MRRTAVFLFLVASIGPASAAAQCIGHDLNPANPCEICENGDYVPLPLRTACSDDRRVHCDDGVYRTECIADPNNSGGVVCGAARRFGDACPNGMACLAGICLQTCVTDNQCQPAYACTDGTCSPRPDADMGGTSDMGGTPDMGGTSDMGGKADTGGEADMAERDMANRPDAGGDAGNGRRKQEKSSGCATAGSATSPWLLLLGFLFLGRRRA